MLSISLVPLDSLDQVLPEAPGVVQLKQVPDLRHQVERAGDGVTPLEPAALDQFCIAQIARFKRPKRYIEVKALPKSSYGKVLKREMKAQYGLT